ncbi:unnamed protein product [Rhizoctonia solani]|uniref:F-box domain-containing protein n=1 Tax=Rhizoctonia solani TaxID=456999 RepID=A0A8H3E8G8_9AGAM|nr:unnamed protein product [Rhizoctonia solani]
MNHPTRLDSPSLNHDTHTTIGGMKDETGAGEITPPFLSRKRARYESPVQYALPAYSPLEKMLFDLPLELLVEIATYLRPLDIVRLARVNKICRGLIMRRSAACIWRAALRTANALPPTPISLAEPRLTALLFLAECSICGGYTGENVDFYLQVKLCVECRGTDIIPVTDPSVTKFIFASSSKGTLMASSKICLREDYKRIKSKYQALQAARDPKALGGWTKEQLKIVEDRSKSARLLSKWQKNWMKTRPASQNQRLSRKERRQLTNARVASIEARMIEMGYQRSEVRHLKNLEPKKRREWIANSGPLDEQAWELAMPHLLHHLEKQRKRIRCSERQPTLNGMLLRVQNRLEPISCIQLQLNPEDRDSLSASKSDEIISEPIDNCPISPNSNTILPSFPHSADIPLICADVQVIMEAESPSEAFEFEIQTKESEIEHAAQAWRDVLELTLLDLLPTDTRPADTGTSEYKLVLGTGQGARPLDLLSVGCRKLLRADSIFCVQSPFLTFSDLLHYPENFQGQFKMSDRVKLRCNGTALRIARALLCAIGLPDASHFAMDMIPRLYRCGRCDDKPIFYLWKDLLQHYVKESRANMNDLGIFALRTYEAIDLDAPTHDIGAVYPDKPLVELLDAAAYIPALSAVSNQNQFACLLCPQANGFANGYIDGDNLGYYFQHVHSIDEPIEGVHYLRATLEPLQQ